MKMRFDELFEMRKLTGTKLKDYIRSNGFSKVSFCKKTEISRPTFVKKIVFFTIKKLPPATQSFL